MAGPDTNNAETPAPVWGFGPPSPEPDTKKLDALLASLNGSAERFQTLWFSFLGLTLYLAIAALATTHRDLLLNNPQTLPILNIKVELLPFYVIAPLLYLLFHFYLLMMLALLARTAAEFDKQLRTMLPGEHERERYRAQVGNALFLQLLVGMKGERAGVNALLMGLIALITIVLAPLATLILMQMMFLPYHHLRITWWHRAVVVADLVLILMMTYRCFFPRGFRKAPLVLGSLARKPRWATAMAFCVLLAVSVWPVAYWLSFREGRWAGEPKPSSFYQLLGWLSAELLPPREERDLEVPGFSQLRPDYTETAGGVVFGLFPDRLELRDETIVGEKILEETKKEITSRSGDFVPTLKLDRRDLQAADLSGADLRGVSLNGVDIEEAVLDGTRLDGARISCDLTDWIACARIVGANLRNAQLRGADLREAHLQGADLTGAQLQSANLRAAKLQGADLSKAQLLGINLSSAHLEGANLTAALLQGADLSKAQLQGASFAGAQLQGADLRDANVQNTDFDGAIVWRTHVAGTDLLTARIHDVRYIQEAAPDVDEWIVAGTQFAPAADKTRIDERFSTLKQNFEDAPYRDEWELLENHTRSRDPLGTNYRQRLAEILGDLACAPGDAPYVAGGLVGRPEALHHGRLAALGEQLDAVRRRLEEGHKDPEKCPGVVGFNWYDWNHLETLKPDGVVPTDH